MEANVLGTTHVFFSAIEHNVKRVVYASSSSVFGDTKALPKIEGDEGERLSPYALSKWMNEELADTFARCYDRTSFVGLRYFNVYGPRQSPSGPYAAVIPLFFQAAMNNDTLKIHGDGGQSRDFTYIEDVVEANLLAALAEFEGQKHGRQYRCRGQHAYQRTS